MYQIDEILVYQYDTARLLYPLQKIGDKPWIKNIKKYIEIELALCELCKWACGWISVPKTVVILRYMGHRQRFAANAARCDVRGYGVG